MDPLHVAHLFLLAAWAGLVLAELVVELSATDDAGRRVASRLHRRMDLFIELPLLAGILGTGAWLSARAWPLTSLHWVKIAAGLVAVSANLVCVGFVVARERARDDPPALRRWSGRVRATAVGIPFGIAALVIGLGWFRG